MENRASGCVGFDFKGDPEFFSGVFFSDGFYRQVDGGGVMGEVIVDDDVVNGIDDFLSFCNAGEIFKAIYDEGYGDQMSVGGGEGSECVMQVVDSCEF